MTAIQQLKAAANEAINAAHRGQHAEAVESLSVALARVAQQEYLERQLTDIGFNIPTGHPTKPDPRGREYGEFTAIPGPEDTIQLIHERESADIAWTCTFPSFDDFDTWARAHS